MLFGGASADHAASLHTAYSVLSSLPKEIEPLAIGITRAGRWLFYPGSYENIKDGSWEQDSDCCSCVISPDMTNKGVIKIISDGESTIHRIDAVFPVLHGKYGEDGRVQGLCKLAGLPVIGNDFAAAALCNDRRIMDLVLSDSNIKVIENVTLHRSEMNDMTAAIKDNRQAELPDIHRTDKLFNIGRRLQGRKRKGARRSDKGELFAPPLYHSRECR